MSWPVLYLLYELLLNTIIMSYLTSTDAHDERGFQFSDFDCKLNLCVSDWLYFLGDFSWGLGAETPGVTPAPVLPTAPPPLPRSEDEDDIEDMEEDIQVTVAHLAQVFSALRSVLTPVFFRGIFAFLTWWVAACQLISSLFGIYFHQYLMLS